MLLGPVQRRLARVDLREHEDKILLLLALVIGAVGALLSSPLWLSQSAWAGFC